MTPPRMPPIRVGISACLLGQEVRYDGGHKRDPLILESLGPLFEWFPVCPEVELGLGVPRDALVLEGPAAAPRLVFSDSRRDVTDQMSVWSRRRLTELESSGLCGYIFKSRSPSCGLQGVPLFETGASPVTIRSGTPGGADSPETRPAPRPEGVGLLARALMERFPLLPIEDEEGLHAAARRDAFVERVYSYSRSPVVRSGG